MSKLRRTREEGGGTGSVQRIKIGGTLTEGLRSQYVGMELNEFIEHYE